MLLDSRLQRLLLPLTSFIAPFFNNSTICTVVLENVLLTPLPSRRYNRLRPTFRRGVRKNHHSEIPLFRRNIVAMDALQPHVASKTWAKTITPSFDGVCRRIRRPEIYWLSGASYRRFASNLNLFLGIHKIRFSRENDYDSLSNRISLLAKENS